MFRSGWRSREATSREATSRKATSRGATSRWERQVTERLLSIFVHCHPFFEKCNILVKCHKRCNIHVRLKCYNIFDKGAQLCVIQDRLKNVTYAIIQSDSKIMQYSGRGADDSKYCNIRGRSSRVQCSGQVEEVAKRRVAERRVAERQATSRGATSRRATSPGFPSFSPFLHLPIYPFSQKKGKSHPFIHMSLSPFILSSFASTLISPRGERCKWKCV